MPRIPLSSTCLRASHRQAAEIATGLVLFVELAVSANDEEPDDSRTFLMVDSPIITGNVDAPATSPLSCERTIVEERVEPASGE